MTLESGDRVLAVDLRRRRIHDQYAGRLDREAMLEYVRAGKASRPNAEYILETNDHCWLSGCGTPISNG